MQFEHRRRSAKIQTSFIHWTRLSCERGLWGNITVVSAGRFSKVLGPRPGYRRQRTRAHGRVRARARFGVFDRPACGFSLRRLLRGPFPGSLSAMPHLKISAASQSRLLCLRGTRPPVV